MAKIQIKSETRHELSFFPNSFDDYVPKDSKVRMVDRIVRSMDINPLMDTYDVGLVLLLTVRRCF